MASSKARRLAMSALIPMTRTFFKGARPAAAGSVQVFTHLVPAHAVARRASPPSMYFRFRTCLLLRLPAEAEGDGDVLATLGRVQPVPHGLQVHLGVGGDLEGQAGAGVEAPLPARLVVDEVLALHNARVAPAPPGVAPVAGAVAVLGDVGLQIVHAHAAHEVEADLPLAARIPEQVHRARPGPGVAIVGRLDADLPRLGVDLAQELLLRVPPVVAEVETIPEVGASGSEPR